MFSCRWFLVMQLRLPSRVGNGVSFYGPSDPPPLGFSQVFILKVVKVFCFDAFLQVFILKGLAEAQLASVGRPRSRVLHLPLGYPTPGVLLKESGSG